MTTAEFLRVGSSRFPPAAADCEMKFYIKLGVFSLFLCLSYSARAPLSSLAFFPFLSCHRFFSHAHPRPLCIYVPIDRYIGVCIYIDVAVSPATTHDICAIGCTKNAYLRPCDNSNIHRYNGLITYAVYQMERHRYFR